jgi:hypothetical protein
MNKTLLTLVALALLTPAASAHHWTDDNGTPRIGDSDCTFTGGNTCPVAYLCTEGTPPQIVDTVLHCAGRLASEAQPTAVSVVDWTYVYAEDQAEVAENQPSLVNAATAGERGAVNDVLCGTVWSLFCTVPVALPEHVPVDDPLR